MNNMPVDGDLHVIVHLPYGPSNWGLYALPASMMEDALISRMFHWNQQWAEMGLTGPVCRDDFDIWSFEKYALLAGDPRMPSRVTTNDD